MQGFRRRSDRDSRSGHPNRLWNRTTIGPELAPIGVLISGAPFGPMVTRAFLGPERDSATVELA